MSALLYKMEVCDLGIEWFTAVQHGSNLRKGENTVEFKTLFPILKKYLADDADVPCFFRELMAMITTVTEEEWGSSKDPSTKTKDETLRTYAKRGISQKLAKTIVYRLTPEILVERINEKSETVRNLLASDLHGYNASLNAENVAEQIAAWMVEIVQTRAGLIQQSELEKQKQKQAEAGLRNKYGYYLLNEVGHYCPFPGCGRPLTVSKDGKAADAYCVSVIDKKKAPEVRNLLALCPQCYATYSIDGDPKVSKELLNVKKILETRAQSLSLIDDLPLEKGIIRAIGKIKKLNEKDLADASLDPKEIKQKLRPADNIALYHTISLYVTTYFVKIKEIMMNLDKRGEIDYEEVQDQMKAIYRRLKKAKKTNMEIFNEIVAKIHRISLQEDIYCQIVVSYFVQSCEVFDAITE